MVTSIKGHFDGSNIVLDEPVSLAVGQTVRIVVETGPTEATSHSPRKLLTEFADGMIEATFTPFADMTATLMNGDEWDESVALHIDPLDAIPSDFVRKPGSAAGQIQMAEDFNATPNDFEEYL